MNLALWMVERRELLQRRGTSIDGDAAGVGIGNEAVVDVRLFLLQGESLFGADARVLFDGPSGNAAIVYDLVLVCDEVHFRSRDSGPAR